MLLGNTMQNHAAAKHTSSEAVRPCSNMLNIHRKKQCKKHGTQAATHMPFSRFAASFCPSMSLNILFRTVSQQSGFGCFGLDSTQSSSANRMLGLLHPRRKLLQGRRGPSILWLHRDRKDRLSRRNSAFSQVNSFKGPVKTCPSECTVHPAWPGFQCQLQI